MSKFEETITVDYARITCDQCGISIKGYDGAHELETDAALCGWEFCYYDTDARELTLLNDDYRDADLHFCSPECMENWLIDNDITHAVKQG